MSGTKLYQLGKHFVVGKINCRDFGRQLMMLSKSDEHVPFLAIGRLVVVIDTKKEATHG